MTEAVEHEDCLASLEEAATRYQSLLQHAQEAGLATGLVTTDSLTGASPAGGGWRGWSLVTGHWSLVTGHLTSAVFRVRTLGLARLGEQPGHAAQVGGAALLLSWWCRCEDLAAQLVRRRPGSGLRVILGGGKQHFNNSAGAEDGRTDGADLVAEWLEARRAEVSANQC